VLGGVLLTAFGMGVVIPVASVVVTSRVPPDERGLAGALFSTSQQVGQAVGLAVLATIAAARTVSAHGSLVSGYRLAYLIATGIVVAAIVLALLQRPVHQTRSATAGKAEIPDDVTNRS
jgi:MFS family permease